MTELLTWKRVVDSPDDTVIDMHLQKVGFSACLELVVDSFFQLSKSDTIVYQSAVDRPIRLSIGKLRNG